MSSSKSVMVNLCYRTFPLCAVAEFCHLFSPRQIPTYISRFGPLCSLCFSWCDIKAKILEIEMPSLQWLTDHIRSYMNWSYKNVILLTIKASLWSAFGVIIISESSNERYKWLILTDGLQSQPLCYDGRLYKVSRIFC